jgi:hypothetical protein
MDSTKSKFTKDALYWLIPFSLFLITISIVLLINGAIKSLNDQDILSLFLGILLFIGLPVFYINILKIRYYVIHPDKLKYHSFWCPFGKTLYFDNYIGKVIQTESGSGGSYKVVYLVNKKRKTAFKIMGLHYKNFDEMNDAIPIKKISFSPSVGEYFKLLFFERVSIPDKKEKTQAKSKTSG